MLFLSCLIWYLDIKENQNIWFCLSIVWRRKILSHIHSDDDQWFIINVHFIENLQGNHMSLINTVNIPNRVYTGTLYIPLYVMYRLTPIRRNDDVKWCKCFGFLGYVAFFWYMYVRLFVPIDYQFWTKCI